MLMMKLLPIWGTMFRTAWGRMTLVMVCTWVMPMAWAPSVWPGSTEMMPPRTDSAIYAPVLMETTMREASQMPELPWKAVNPSMK